MFRQRKGGPSHARPNDNHGRSREPLLEDDTENCGYQDRYQGDKTSNVYDEPVQAMYDSREKGYDQANLPSRLPRCTC